MATIQSKQLERKQPERKQLERKQLKRTYKIPRSLKKSIKKSLVKIVKKREQKIREEERKKQSIQQEEYHYELYSQFLEICKIWRGNQTNETLNDALDAPLFRMEYTLNLEEARLHGGLLAQKNWAREMIETRQGNEELHNEIRAWLVEHGEDADEVEKLGRDDEETGLDDTEEYDWTSTSTLE